MTPEIKEKIYTPFFTTKPAGEGIGLGLFISRKIVEEHGGEISFTSEVGNTEFVIRFAIQGSILVNFTSIELKDYTVEKELTGIEESIYTTCYEHNCNLGNPRWIGSK